MQHQHRIVLAGPTTLQAMLNAFRMVIRAVAIEKRSTEVWQLLGTVRTELDSNSVDIVQLQQQLSASLDTLDLVRSRTGTMRRHLQGVDTIGSDNIPDLLGLNPALQQAAE